MKGSKVSDFGDKSLNAYSEDAQIYLNPLMPSAGTLQLWLEGQDEQSLNFENISQVKKPEKPAEG